VNICVVVETLKDIRFRMNSGTNLKLSSVAVLRRPTADLSCPVAAKGKNMKNLALTVAVLTLAGGLVACGKKEEKQAVVAVAASAPEPVVESISNEQQLAAMLRGHPNSRKICIDGERKHAFFMDYGPLPPPGTEDDGKWHGWIFIENVDFYKTSNNTYFITDQDQKKYAQVYPDVTGLQCKGQ